MLGSKLPVNHLQRSTSTAYFSLRSSSSVSEATGGGKSVVRKAVKAVLICLTGGLALSAIDDLAIYHGCTSKALEKATHNQEVVQALGEPIVRGPWYNASLAVAHRRHSVSCTFPVSGPQGTGMFQLKAIRQDNGWFSVLRPQAWNILIMEALLHVPENEEEKQTFRITLLDDPRPSPSTKGKNCIPQDPGTAVRT